MHLGPRSLARLLAVLLALQLCAPGPSLAADRSTEALGWFQAQHTGESPIRPSSSDRITEKLTSNWTLYGLTQHDRYELNVEPGALEISVTPDEKSGGARLFLYNIESHKVLLNRRFDGRSAETERLTLTEASHLQLILINNELAAVTMSGQGLRVHPITPAISLPIAPYTIMNAPTTIQAGLMNPAETGRLELYWGQNPLSGNLLQPDGSVAPYTLNTSDLPDGVYDVWLLGTAKEPGSESALERRILIDRSPNFNDVPFEHWAHHPIEVMYHERILSGRERSRFAPEEPVTRAEFATMLALTLQLPIDPDGKNPFADVPNDWSRPYIAALYKAGLAQGVRVDGHLYYYPNRTITRAEAATILGRALNRAHDADYTPTFSDWAEVPIWAQPSVANLAQMGWLSGFPDRSYRPQAELLRSQAAKVLSKFLGM